MDKLPEQAEPRVQVTLRSSRRTTEVRIQVSWCCRLSVPTAARLLAAAAIVLTATAVAIPAHDEITRGALYIIAGLLTAIRPRTRT